MKSEKKVIYTLDKCYSVAPLTYEGEAHFLVAAEKVNECVLFDMEGNVKDVIWKEPGGTMSMVQVPGSNGQFLATHKFYSPNDSKEAKIVIVTPKSKENWEIRTLVELPHVHRFDIVQRNGVNYLIACTLKSGHNHKEDWSMPGKVYAAVLPEDLSSFDEGNQLKLQVIQDHMMKNHGYYRVKDKGVQTCIISAECGVFHFTPPCSEDGEWEITRLLDTPASDAVLVDLDEDGEEELTVLSPFHGSEISIYKKEEGHFHKVYEYEKPAEFLHAIYGGLVCNKPALILGHRQGEQNLMLFSYNKEHNTYQVQLLDTACGSANVFVFQKENCSVLISANRETDEVAMYTLRADEQDEEASRFTCHE